MWVVVGGGKGVVVVRGSWWCPVSENCLIRNTIQYKGKAGAIEFERQQRGLPVKADAIEVKRQQKGGLPTIQRGKAKTIEFKRQPMGEDCRRFREERQRLYNSRGSRGADCRHYR